MLISEFRALSLAPSGRPVCARCGGDDTFSHDADEVQVELRSAASIWCRGCGHTEYAPSAVGQPAS